MTGTSRVTCADFDEAIGPDPVGTYQPDFLFQVPPLKRYRDKVAIVGFTDHRVRALDLGDDFEIWGLNELYRYMPPERFHRWFEIHGREYLSKDAEGKKHIEDLKSALGPLPIYMQQHHADIPGSVRFPIEELIEHFGGRQAIGADYFTNCPAMMIAYAIALGFRELHCYGVDMAQDGEYATQRPCCEYWLGRAVGLGIKVHVPDLSDLLKCIGTYGYEDSGSVLSRKLQERIKWLHSMDNERLAQIRGLEANYQRQHGELTSRAYRTEGAIAEVELQRKSERRDDRLTALRAELQSTQASLQGLENEYRQKNEVLMRDRNQIVGGIHNSQYLLRSWSMLADNPAGGNIPTAEQRAADPRTGLAQAGDTKQLQAAAV